jgi:hypothetical protein
MRDTTKKKWIGVILFFVLISQDANAYLDPGTGSLIFQVLIASLLGLIIYLRAWWSRVISFIHGLISKKRTK